MSRIIEKDWSFEKIRDVDADRAERLESLASPDELVKSLAETLNGAIDRKEIRIAADSQGNTFTNRRPILQFQVTPELYDWFFNGRTGYRAQFWIDPKVGMEFNGRIIQALAEVLNRRLPATVTARRIEVTTEGGSRKEKDTGTVEITRDERTSSLMPDTSKIWICERLYSLDSGHITCIGFATLSYAAKYQSKLCVPRWAEATNPETRQKGEGLRAPFPCPEYSWLDLKGGFQDDERNPSQIKSQDKRANQIHRYGWT